MKKALSFLLAFALTAAMLAGCDNEAGGGSGGPQSEASQESKATNEGKKVTLGYVHQTLNNPIFVHMNNMMKDEAQKLGVELIILDSQDDVSKEMSNVEDLISRGVDVIGQTSCDAEGSAAAIKTAVNAKIPFINVDRFVDGAGATTQIASDNVMGGKIVCQKIAEDAGDKEVNVVVVRGKMGATTDTERDKGFKEELKNHSNLKVVAEQSGNFDRTKGFEAMENILQAQDKIDYIFALNDEMAIGTCQAIEAAGRQDEGIKVVGFDGSPDGMEYINNGKLWGLIFQDFDAIGRTIVRNAVTLAEGGTVDPEQRLEVIFCTKDNYGDLVY